MQCLHCVACEASQRFTLCKACYFTPEIVRVYRDRFDRGEIDEQGGPVLDLDADTPAVCTLAQWIKDNPERVAERLAEWKAADAKPPRKGAADTFGPWLPNEPVSESYPPPKFVTLTGLTPASPRLFLELPADMEDPNLAQRSWIQGQVSAWLAGRSPCLIVPPGCRLKSLAADGSVADVTEQATSRTVKQTLRPSSLDVQVGSVTIRSASPGAWNSEITIDGKPFPVKSITIKGGVDCLWTVEMEFYPALNVKP